MEFRPLGRTGLSLPVLGFGASSLGQEFRSVDLNEAIASVRTALDLGMTFIDTSPFYGRGMSEVLVLHGSPGSGKSTLAGVIAELLRVYDKAHAVIDLDEISLIFPSPGRDFALRNLEAIWPHYAAVPGLRLIVPSVIADAAPALTIAASHCSSDAMRSPTRVNRLLAGVK